MTNTWNKASAGIAVTSLFIALGGPATAASLITGKNVKNSSLTGADVKNSSLTGADVKNSSLTGGDVKSSSLTGSDIKNRSLTAADFAAGQLAGATQGPAGPAGAKGDTGAPGPQGAPGFGRFVTVNKEGQIEAQSGGFSVVSAYQALGNGALGPAANVYINAGEPLANNGIVASLGLQNQSDVDGGGNAGRTTGADANSEFSGELVSSRCQITGFVACAPPAAQNTNSFVVSPRNSDGSFTGATGTTGATGADAQTTDTRKRFTVIITGDSSDFNPALLPAARRK